MTKTDKLASEPIKDWEMKERTGPGQRVAAASNPTSDKVADKQLIGDETPSTSEKLQIGNPANPTSDRELLDQAKDAFAATLRQRDEEIERLNDTFKAREDYWAGDSRTLMAENKGLKNDLNTLEIAHTSVLIENGRLREALERIAKYNNGRDQWSSDIATDTLKVRGDSNG